jgi:hypothetical protein
MRRQMFVQLPNSGGSEKTDRKALRQASQTNEIPTFLRSGEAGSSG